MKPQKCSQKLGSGNLSMNMPGRLMWVLPSRLFVLLYGTLRPHVSQNTTQNYRRCQRPSSGNNQLEDLREDTCVELKFVRVVTCEKNIRHQVHYGFGPEGVRYLQDLVCPLHPQKRPLHKRVAPNEITDGEQVCVTCFMSTEGEEHFSTIYAALM